MTFHGCRCQRNKKKCSQAIIRLSILRGHEFKRLVTFENQESVRCHWGRASFFSRRSPWVSSLLTDSLGWEFVLVETEYIFCLLGYTWRVLSSLPLDSTDTLRFSLAVSRWWRRGTSLCASLCSHPCLCASALHQLVYCKHITEGVHVSGRVCLNVQHYIFSVCDTWRFAPKANKSVMPGIRPWPLLKLHRQAERLINQTASHRCDGFHTNRQQTVKVTSNRVNCQPGRQAALFCSLSLSLSPSVVLISHSPFTSSHLQHDASVWYIWNICLVPLKTISRVEKNPCSQRVVMVKPFWGHKTSVITAQCSVLWIYLQHR